MANAKELLLESAADSQRERGMMPTCKANDEYLVGILERMDKTPKRRVSSDRKPGKSPEKLRDAAVNRAKQRGFELSGDFSVSRRSETPLALGGSMVTAKRMGIAEKRMRARLALLRSKPDWAEKLKRVNPLALQGAIGKTPEEKHYKREQAAQAIRDILAASDAVFGEWQKPHTVRSLFSYQGQVKH